MSNKIIHHPKCMSQGRKTTQNRGAGYAKHWHRQRKNTHTRTLKRKWRLVYEGQVTLITVITGEGKIRDRRETQGRKPTKLISETKRKIKTQCTVDGGVNTIICGFHKQEKHYNINVPTVHRGGSLDPFTHETCVSLCVNLVLHVAGCRFCAILQVAAV